jgi:transposase-like protein
VTAFARNQTVTEEFRSLLVEMRENRDPRLPMVFRVAKLNGWTLKSLGDAVGITREYVRQLIASANMDASMTLPDVPLAPRKPNPPHKPPRRYLGVKPEVADQLRDMQEVAAKVNGGTPADAPERRISEEFSAALSALTEQGVSVYRLAKALGVTNGAIQSRLARHGYRELPESQKSSKYLGRAIYEGPMQGNCKRGHPLTGDNLYVVPKTGNRACRECGRMRSREYLERKRAVITKQEKGGVL